MNYSLQNNDDFKQFPVYSLFPNDTTSKIDEHSENQTTNLPRKLIHNERSRPSSKLAPIGTGRPSSNRNSSGQTNPNMELVRTYQPIQMENRQCFLTTSTLPISGQIFSPFNQNQWANVPTSLAHQQFYSMNPIGIVPNQQNSNGNKTVWTPLPVDRLPKLFVSHGQSQLYMWNLQRYVNEKAIQGLNNNYRNQNLNIPQPFSEVFDAMATPKRAIDGFPRKAIDVLSGQVIHGYGPIPRQDYRLMPWHGFSLMPRQNYGSMPKQGYDLMPRQDYGPMPRQDYDSIQRQDYGSMPKQDYGPKQRQDYGPIPRQDFCLMPRQDGDVMNIEGNDHNGNKQTMPAQQQILNHDSEIEGGAETKNSKNNTRRRRTHIFYNSNYGRRCNNNNKS